MKKTVTPSSHKEPTPGGKVGKNLKIDKDILVIFEAVSIQALGSTPSIQAERLIARSFLPEHQDRIPADLRGAAARILREHQDEIPADRQDEVARFIRDHLVEEE